MRLINRTTRRQSLTDFGRAYYERCRVVLAEAEAADALVADQLSEPRGRLRVTMPALLGRRCVAPILLDFAKQHPSLELELSFTDRIVDLVEDGFDLAVRTGNLEDRAGMIARRIARHSMIVCASPSYVEMHGRPRGWRIWKGITPSSTAGRDGSFHGCFRAMANLLQRLPQ